jgi:hypothetical protein
MDGSDSLEPSRLDNDASLLPELIFGFLTPWTYLGLDRFIFVATRDETIFALAPITILVLVTTGPLTVLVISRRISGATSRVVCAGFLSACALFPWGLASVLFVFLAVTSAMGGALGLAMDAPLLSPLLITFVLFAAMRCRISSRDSVRRRARALLLAAVVIAAAVLVAAVAASSISRVIPGDIGVALFFAPIFGAIYFGLLQCGGVYWDRAQRLLREAGPGRSRAVLVAGAAFVSVFGLVEAADRAYLFHRFRQLESADPDRAIKGVHGLSFYPLGLTSRRDDACAAFYRVRDTLSPAGYLTPDELRLRLEQAYGEEAGRVREAAADIFGFEPEERCRSLFPIS